MASQVPVSKKTIKPEEKLSPPSKDIEKPEDYKQTFRGRGTASKVADPCAEASKASMACLERMHYNREGCMEFFRAYRECKGKWIEQRREDRRLGRDSA